MTTLALIPTRIERDLLSLRNSDELLVRVCGMGPLAAGVLSTRWIEELQPSACILVGIAGTRDAVRAPIGSLVVGTSVRNQAVGFGHSAAFQPLSDMAPAGEDVAPDPLPLDVPSAWLKVGTQVLGDGTTSPAIVAGEIGTVAAASASVEESDGWLARDPGVLVEEMEGYAVALACREAGLPLSIVRGVSNRAGVRDKRQWEAAAALSSLRDFLERAVGVAT
jgi:futalosine hydrolase